MPQKHHARHPSIELPDDLYGRSSTGQSRPGADYVWLAYSVFFFIEPVLRHSVAYWLAQLPFYAVFLALYVTYVRRRSRVSRLLCIAGIGLLGAVSIPSNVGGSSFFIYVGAMLPFCVESATIFLAVMLAEVGVLAVERHFFPGQPINYLITGFFTVVVGVSNLFVAQNKRGDLKLHRAQEENLQLVAVAERERIARDLHDVLGHTLSVIVLKAELAGRLLGQPSLPTQARAAGEIADIERTARTALAEVREAIGGYRAKGLTAEVEQARQTLNAAGVTLDCPTAAPSLRPGEETVLALAVREAVTNIVRHARATRCTVRFTRSPEGFDLLEVADDGCGAAAAPEGNGLRGMRERAEALGGRLRVLSAGQVFAAGQAAPGTRLLVELPHRTQAPR